MTRTNLWGALAIALAGLVVTTPAFADTIDDDGDCYCEDSSSCTSSTNAACSTISTNDCDDTDVDTYPGAAYNQSGNACRTDADGDGYGSDSPASGVTAGTDCDDSDSFTFPGAAQNQSSNGCMTDVDDDGYGSDSPATGVTAGSDCDDSDAFTYVGSASLDGAALCTRDLDGDNYGDDNPSNANVDAGTDCDDAVITTFPGAASTDSITDCMADADGDNYGDDNPSNANVTAGTDCDDTASGVNPGVSETWYNGVDDDCSGNVSDYDADGDGEDHINFSGGTDCHEGTAQDDEVTYPNADNLLPELINSAATETWYDGTDQDCNLGSDYDADVDGFDSDSYGGTDCDDTDPNVNTSASETWYNGVDDDCSGNASDFDADSDGYDSDLYSGQDCNDANPSINPGASETWYNGTDENCDNASDYDADSDGYNSDAYGGQDCNDTASAINPAATEIWYDGTDQNCDNASDYDADVDTYDSDGYGGDDCDDTDSSVNIAATEIWYDGTDQDCNGLSDYDADEDTYDSDGYGGTDCDDTDNAINPAATEVWYNGVDQDCNGLSDYDADEDTYDSSLYGGTDCDDTDPSISGGSNEVWYDGVDQNCDGWSDFDADYDGQDHMHFGGDDCHEGTSYDDTTNHPNNYPLDPDQIYLGATETWYDGTDQDCDGANDYDADGDGYTHLTYGGTDCHEGTSADDLTAYPNDANFQPDIIHPGAVETWYDGTDQDCSGGGDYDQDGDGEDSDVYGGTDCDDFDSTINTAATEVWYNGVDQDCDGLSDYDADYDGEDSDLYGGTDCDDADATISAAATEVWYDGTDQDCDGWSDYDADFDGEDHINFSGTDCYEGTSEDDTTAYPNDGGLAADQINAAASETWYDGTDQDCDGWSDFDADYDGEDHLNYSGTDCHEGTTADDTTAYPNDGGLAADTINAAATDTWYDGTDQDCDGADDYDADSDGDPHINYGGTDCHEGTSEDDTTAYPNDAGLAANTINGSATEVWYDGTDQDCDGNSDYDADVDGHDSDAYSGDDCDDTNAEVSPSSAEVCETGNQIDNDCDGDVNTEGGSPFLGSGEGITAYIDLDADGFGARWEQNSDGTYVYDTNGNQVAYSSVQVCSYETGWSTSGTDCDDYDNGRYPGAPEYCDGEDDDCDDQADEPDDLATDAGCVDLYRDVDGDGYGDLDVSLCLCLTGSSTSTSYGGYDYTDQIDDCVDTDPNVYPYDPCNDGADNDGDGLTDYNDPECNTCADGIDNNGDGLTDSDDDLCRDATTEPQEDVNFDTARWTEDGQIIPIPVDGDDNDCDGRVLALELDCDDDGALPALPIAAPTAGTSSAAELGLTPCDPDVLLTGQTDAGVLEVPCWSDQDNVRLLCDAATGLWLFSYTESTDAFGSRYSGGKRIYSATRTCSGTSDCDDQCSSRCPDASESCDGIDNDCSGVVIADASAYDSIYAGLPDSMISGAQSVGTVSLEEIDLDGDGVFSCGSFSTSSSQPYDGGGSCDAEALNTDTTLDDCNSLCGITFPAATERCDGFLGDCDGAAEGTDADGDGLETCGPWVTDGTIVDEDVYVIVASWGSGTTTTGTGGTGMGGTGLGGTGLTDSGGSTGGTGTSTGGTGTTTGGTGDTGGTSGVASFNGLVVPLMLPRSGTSTVTNLTSTVAACDVTLATELLSLESALGLSGIVDAAMTAGTPESLVDLCLASDANLSCDIVRLTLTETSDTDTCDSTTRWTTGFLPDCTGWTSDVCIEPAEEITRTVWTPARIFAARRTVARYDCERLYGTTCDLVDTSTMPSQTLSTSVNDADEAVAATAWLWWKELARYSPAKTSLVVGWCWGDPAYDLGDSKQVVGGDCSDGDATANRDTPEGPQDLLGIWYARQGTLTSAETCAACLDGIDNNCDGLIDCADPTCAACFVGQGAGCGGGSQSPCAQGGCAGTNPIGWKLQPHALWLALVGLLAAGLRRRSERADS
ncbi:MAG: hypothetical protein H6739_34880 [Alphaproteobacteria bacterium]|nr:hypothetical protein [Alphaproteobacteria bacterium]